MKFGYMTLFVLLTGLSGCATNGTKPLQAVHHAVIGTLIIKPISFSKDAYIRDAVKQECDLDGKLTQFIKENAAGQYANIVTDSNTGQSDAQVLTVEIEEVQGAAGGAWSGAKSVVIKGSLSQKDKMLGDFKARRYSGGGMFGGYKGSGESLFLSKDFPCSQRGNPQKYRDKLNCYASPSRPGHSFATQQGDGSHALQ